LEGRLDFGMLPSSEQAVFAHATAITPTDRYPCCMDLVRGLESACGLSSDRPLPTSFGADHPLVITPTRNSDNDQTIPSDQVIELQKQGSGPRPKPPIKPDPSDPQSGLDPLKPNTTVIVPPIGGVHPDELKYLRETVPPEDVEKIFQSVTLDAPKRSALKSEAVRAKKLKSPPDAGSDDFPVPSPVQFEKASSGQLPAWKSKDSKQTKKSSSAGAIGALAALVV